MWSAKGRGPKTRTVKGDGHYEKRSMDVLTEGVKEVQSLQKDSLLEERVSTLGGSVTTRGGQTRDRELWRTQCVSLNR